MLSALSEEERQRARQAAAEAAAELVEPGMVVGLGTGDTANWFVRALARRAAGGLRVARCVPTSVRTAELAAGLGLPLCELDELPAVGRSLPIDLTVDGADEIDGALRLIKGGGGALLREKLVAHASRRLVIIADAGKRVARLGASFRLPLEVVPFGAAQTVDRILADFPGAALRQRDGVPARSDGGNRIVDVPLSEQDAADLPGVHRCLKLTLGVIETGLFLEEAERVFIGAPDGSVTDLRR